MKKILLLSLLGVALSTQITALSDELQQNGEKRVRAIIEPILDRYCADECKLIQVQAQVGLHSAEDVAPGFEDVDADTQPTRKVTQAYAKILLDEKLAPTTRSRILELIRQHTQALDFSVEVNQEVRRFPSTQAMASKINEVRERTLKSFKSSVESVLSKFCPQECVLTDVELDTELVQLDEAQPARTSEIIQDQGLSLRVRDLSATLLIDSALEPEQIQNLFELTKLKASPFKNTTWNLKTIAFPKRPESEGIDGSLPGSNGVRFTPARKLSSILDENRTQTETRETRDQKELREQREIQQRKETAENTTSNENRINQETQSRSKVTEDLQQKAEERLHRIERIERVEQGDAVQTKLEEFQLWALIFGCIGIALLTFIALAAFRKPSTTVVSAPTEMRSPGNPTNLESSDLSPPVHRAEAPTTKSFKDRIEIETLKADLMRVFSEEPRVAKIVFGRVLGEEGIEATAAYLDIFGESILIELLRDPSMQRDLNDLLDFYSRNTFEIEDEEKLQLLRKLHHRTVSGKLHLLGSRSSQQFDFLADMDGLQVLELVRNESMTVKGIVITQCDPQKRSTIFSHLDSDTRMRLLAELSRIDYLPREYIFNVAQALKRKRQENPKLNTEALPGSEVLIHLLERAESQVQKQLVQSLQVSNPDSARLIKSKLVSLETLCHLPDGQLLEVILALKHDELLQFLAGLPPGIREKILQKCPKDLSSDLHDELEAVQSPTRENYQMLERRILNRMKMMSTDGALNLVEANERIFDRQPEVETRHLRKAAGWT
jgi:flagellar motor switch protein FliG